MSPDLRELLDDAAREPSSPLDVDDIVRRGRRRRATRFAAVAAVVVAVVVAGAVGVFQLVRTEPVPPVVGEEPVEPDPSGPTPPEDRASTVSPDAVGADVLEVVGGEDGQDGEVVVHHRDGGTTRLPLGTADPAGVSIVPDDRGGFTWQSTGDAAGSPSIEHVERDGSTTTVIASTTAPGEAYRLVGGDLDQVLVTRRTGDAPDTTVVDLMIVAIDGGDQRVVEREIAGEGDRVGSAVYLDHSVYTLAAAASSRVVLDRLDGDPTLMYESGQPTVERAVGVGRNGNGQVFALIHDGSDEVPSARLLVIEPFEEMITDTLDVPLDLGAEGSAPRATEVSAEGRRVLVNRAVGGDHLSPLLYDLREERWSVVDVDGRALLGRSSGTDESAEQAACAQDTERVNAPPTGGETLDLYLGCASGGDFWERAYQFDTDVARSGDVAQDAAAVLRRLFEGPTSEQADRGYFGLDPDTGQGTIGIHEVRFSDGTLVVDFDFPETGVGNYGTSTGMGVWHLLVTANLLQSEEVQRLELLADGTCEDYSRSFEGSGCASYERRDAPWG